MLRIKYIAVLSAFAMTLAVSALGAEGSDSATAATVEQKVKVRKMPFRGTIKSVDLKARTITLESKTKGRMFPVAKQCKIARLGEKCELKSLKPGETVGGLAQENADKKWEVITLNIGKKPKKGEPQV